MLANRNKGTYENDFQYRGGNRSVQNTSGKPFGTSSCGANSFPCSHLKTEPAHLLFVALRLFGDHHDFKTIRRL